MAAATAAAVIVTVARVARVQLESPREQLVAEILGSTGGRDKDGVSIEKAVGVSHQNSSSLLTSSEGQGCPHQGPRVIKLTSLGALNLDTQDLRIVILTGHWYQPAMALLAAAKSQGLYPN
jgi:hypothetical protein